MKTKMKTQKKTWIQLNKELFDAEAIVMNLKSELRSHPSDSWMRTVMIRDNRMFADHTALLVEEINNRDYPMTYRDIKEVFELSGLEFTEKDVLACNPDTQEAVDEEIRFYRE